MPLVAVRSGTSSAGLGRIAAIASLVIALVASSFAVAGWDRIAALVVGALGASSFAATGWDRIEACRTTLADRKPTLAK